MKSFVVDIAVEVYNNTSNSNTSELLSGPVQVMLTSDARSDGHECAECSAALNHHLPDARHKFPPSEAVPVKTKLGLTRLNKIAIQGTPQMAADKEAICLSRVHSYYSKGNLLLF